MFNEMLKSHDVVKVTTEDGRDSDSVSVASDTPGQHRVAEKVVPFVVPDGYVRGPTANFQKSHGPGDSAESHYANSDPHDGSVYLHVRCSGVHGFARAAVSDVYAIKEKAAKRLNEMAKAAKSATKEK